MHAHCAPADVPAGARHYHGNPGRPRYTIDTPADFLRAWNAKQAPSNINPCLGFNICNWGGNLSRADIANCKCAPHAPIQTRQQGRPSHTAWLALTADASLERSSTCVHALHCRNRQLSAWDRHRTHLRWLARLFTL